MQFLQLILALSLLILVHEAGHFLFAKLFGIRVDKFYLFFDAGNVRLFSTKNNKLLTRLFPSLKDAETDYGIGWLPLGGYCKINGMVDESMDLKHLAEEAKPYEFRAHPAWQRLLVMFGGVFFNFILAVVVFTGMLSYNGQSYISNEGNSIYANALAGEMGFRTGDRILSYDDYVPSKFNMLQADFARRSPDVVTVLRDGDTVRLRIDHALIGEVLNSPDFLTLAIPFVVDSIPETSVNYGGELQKGDKLIAINGTRAEYVQDCRNIFAEYAGSEVEVSVMRQDSCVLVPVRVDTAGLVGIYLKAPEVYTQKYTFAQAIPAGFRLTFSQIGGYLQDLKLVATPSTGAYKSVGSFIAIGQAFPKLWDWAVFFNIVAMLSIMLAVMNLIPIPGLDGGHIVLTLYEMISGRKPSEKFLVVTQTIGMILLLMLMMLAFGNDITRLFR